VTRKRASRQSSPARVKALVTNREKGAKVWRSAHSRLVANVV